MYVYELLLGVNKYTFKYREKKDIEAIMDAQSTFFGRLQCMCAMQSNVVL